METQGSSGVVVAVLVPVVTAVVGVIAVVFQERYARRSVSGRRESVYQDAQRQVTLAHEWWQAQRALSDEPEVLAATRERAQKMLDDAVALVAKVPQPHVAERPFSVTGLLLLYGMTRAGAKVIRVLFFVSLAWFVLNCIVVAGQAASPEGVTDAIWQYLALALFGVVSLLLRFWAVSADRAKPAPGLSSPQPS